MLEWIIGILLFFILLIIAAILSMGIKKVNQYEKGLIERWNAYEKTVDPGLRFIIPFVQRMFRVNMREQVIDVPPPRNHHRRQRSRHNRRCNLLPSS